MCHNNIENKQPIPSSKGSWILLILISLITPMGLIIGPLSFFTISKKIKAGLLSKKTLKFSFVCSCISTIIGAIQLILFCFLVFATGYRVASGIYLSIVILIIVVTWSTITIVAAIKAIENTSKIKDF